MNRALSALGLSLAIAALGTGCQAARVAHDATSPPGLLRYDNLAAHSNCQNARPGLVRPGLFGRHAGRHANAHADQGYGGQYGGYGADCPNCQPHGGMGMHAGMGMHGMGGPGFPGGHHQQLYTQQPHMGPNGPPTGQYAYPYYTTRAPRDFFVNNPPSVGP